VRLEHIALQLGRTGCPDGSAAAPVTIIVIVVPEPRPDAGPRVTGCSSR
jgi:hypothetical protein